MDSVTSFLSALHRSLSLGTIRFCKFKVDFRHDSFNFLFKNKGARPTAGRGLLFCQEVFDNHYFKEYWFVCFDRLGNGCTVDFPIRLEPVLKQGPIRFVKTNSGELVR